MGLQKGLEMARLVQKPAHYSKIGSAGDVSGGGLLLLATAGRELHQAL